MSDMFWENDTETGRESNAMRALREKAEADSKKITELTDAVSKLTEKLNSNEVTKVVSTKGLDPRVAELAKSAVGTDPQAVEAWLEKNGDLFAKAGTPATPGQEPTPESEGEQPPASEVPADEQVALAAFAAAAQGSEPAKGMEALQSKISSVNSPEELAALLGQGLV